jgi:hypothetical protein
MLPKQIGYGQIKEGPLSASALLPEPFCDASENVSASIVAAVTFTVDGRSKPFTLAVALSASGRLTDSVFVQINREKPSFATLQQLDPTDAGTVTGTLSPGTYNLVILLGAENQILPSAVSSASGAATGNETFILE